MWNRGGRSSDSQECDESHDASVQGGDAQNCYLVGVVDQERLDGESVEAGDGLRGEKSLQEVVKKKTSRRL